MLKEIMKDQYKFKEEFDVREGESLPMDKIESIVNNINKNLFHVEETLQRMYVSYF